MPRNNVTARQDKARALNKEFKLIADGAPTMMKSEMTLGNSLGAGTFADVMKISWQGQDCAFKSLAATFPGKGYKREITSHYKAQHENIIRFISMVVVKQSGKSIPGIIMEYAEKGSLDKLIHSPEVELSWSILRRYTKDILSGLEYLHRQGTVHRDIKPHNILIDHHNRAKICDFGFAETMTTDNSPDGLPRFHSEKDTPGTPAYVAAEIWAKSEYSAATDMYAFGVTLFEMATRKAPWSEVDDMKILARKVMQGQYPGVIPGPPEVSPTIQQLAYDCLSKLSMFRPTASEAHMRIDQDTDIHTLQLTNQGNESERDEDLKAEADDLESRRPKRETASVTFSASLR